MATQTDVQQLIQGLAPDGNNGNPNTAYNNAPGIPMMDGNGNWFLQQLPTAASINLTRMAQTGGMGGGVAFPGFQLPPLTTDGTGGVGPVFPNLPPIGNPGQPGLPAIPPVTGGGATGGNVTTPGGSYLETIVNLNGLNTGRGMSTVPTNTGFRPSNGSAGLGGEGLWGSSPWLADKLGVDRTGGMNWKQFLDVITEPLVRGDFYQSNTGTFNTQALGAAVGRLFAGELGGNIGGWLGKSDANTQNLFQNYLDGELNKSQAYMSNSIDAKTQASLNKLIADAVTKFGGSTQTVAVPKMAFSNGVGMGDNAAHWGATGYTNDASGEVAAGFGVGAGNSGFGNFATGRDTRGRMNEY